MAKGRVDVGGYTKVVNGKTVRVKSYKQQRSLMDVLSTPGRAPLGAQSGQFPAGRSLPNTPKVASAKKREAAAALNQIKQQHAAIKKAAPAKPVEKGTFAHGPKSANSSAPATKKAGGYEPQPLRKPGAPAPKAAAKPPVDDIKRSAPPKAAKPPAPIKKAANNELTESEKKEAPVVNDVAPADRDDLKKRAKVVSERVLGKAAANEKPVSATLQNITSSVEGAYLEGFANRLKTESSLTPKIEKRFLEKGLTPEQYEKDIGDALRYTMVAPPGDLTGAADRALKDLVAQGHEVVSIENSWAPGNAYRGINVNLKTKDGLTWELQFHTPDSFRIKSENHADYELMRDPDASEQDRFDAFDRMVKSWDATEQPAGWDTFGDQKQYPPLENPRRATAQSALTEARVPKAPVVGEKRELDTTPEGLEARAKKLTETIDKLVADGQDTQSLNSTQVGGKRIYTPERHRQHVEIIQSLMAEAVAKGAKRDRKAIIAGGLAGAGKTTLLNDPRAGIVKDDYITINPDDIKEKLIEKGMSPEVPGFSPMEASSLIHEESSDISKVLAQVVQSEGFNVIWDVTLSGPVENAYKKIRPLVDEGYSVQGMFVDLPPSESLNRAQNRYNGGMKEWANGEGVGGRYVPPQFIMDNALDETSPYFSLNRQNFEEVKDSLDGWQVWDTSVNGRPAQKVGEGGSAPVEDPLATENVVDPLDSLTEAIARMEQVLKQMQQPA